MTGFRRENPVDDRAELGRVGDRFLREVGIGAEARLPELGDRVVEDSARDALARLDELSELCRRYGGGIHPRTEQVVRTHVVRRQCVGSGLDRRRPQSV